MWNNRNTGLRRFRLKTSAAAGLGLTILGGVVLTGCGGGDSGSQQPIPTQGRANITVTWPTDTPVNSVTAKIMQGTTLIRSVTISKPATGSSTSVLVENLNSGTYMVEADAFASTDGSGTALLTTSGNVVIQGGQTADFNINLTSAVSEITITSPSTGLGENQTMQLTATAKDASGNVLTLPADRFTWLALNPDIATIDQNGLITAISSGVANFRVTEKASGRSGEVMIQIVGLG